MRFKIEHEIRGRLRIHVLQKTMTYRQADTLQYYLDMLDTVTSVKVRERTADVTITYTGSREELLAVLSQFQYADANVPESYLDNSGRELDAQYFEKLVGSVVLRYGNQLFLPLPVRTALTLVKAAKYIALGVKTLAKRRIEVPVLDATAITVSLLQGNMQTAGSIMFLLGIGEILEEWTHKKSVDDLARSLSLHVNRVWVRRQGQEIQVNVSDVAEGDLVVVRAGNVIPFDGVVAQGDAMVNQASLTGEAVPVHKTEDGYVYAGTVLEEGEIVVSVKNVGGDSRFERIVTMIEESEKLKSELESKAEHLADRLVPYTLAGTGLVYLLTRNMTKTLAVLMVDYSCALKLAMPISVLSAIREASTHHVTVKGGRFLEMLSEADTIVFDKTGTLTKAQPTVVEVVSFCEKTPDEMLTIAACLEEHFPHSMAKAVVEAARRKGLVHDEMHSKVEYIVAHGISTFIGVHKVIIGSHHFVFEDEACTVPVGYEQRFARLAQEYSHLYLAMDGELAAVISIEDPLREEAAGIVKELKSAGLRKVVMMTGDSDRVAGRIAAAVGVDEYYAEVLPEDKARYVEQERAQGRKVVMVGDGVNDSPALSAADVGIAISDGAEIAREIADITIAADDLREIVTLKRLSDALMQRIHKNYRFIVGFNTALIAAGISGVIQPTTSALLHNTSTLCIGLNDMKPLL